MLTSLRGQRQPLPGPTRRRGLFQRPRNRKAAHRKAAQQRTPRRYRADQGASNIRQVLECAGAPALFGNTRCNQVGGVSSGGRANKRGCRSARSPIPPLKSSFGFPIQATMTNRQSAQFRKPKETPTDFTDDTDEETLGAGTYGLDLSQRRRTGPFSHPCHP